MEMEKLLTTEEIAEICRTTPDTVRYWRKARTGPPGYKVGRRVLYPETAFRVWLGTRGRPGGRDV